jgi:hypothetical protein
MVIWNSLILSRFNGGRIQRWFVNVESSPTIATNRIGQYVTVNSTERPAGYMLIERPAEASGKAFDTAGARRLFSRSARGGDIL